MSAGAGAPAADDARGSLDELLAAAILMVDGRELTGRDLLAAGVASGRWQRLEREVSEGLGLVTAQPPPDDEVTTRFRAFRDSGFLALRRVFHFVDGARARRRRRLPRRTSSTAQCGALTRT